MMAWTYSGDPANSTLDAIRFEMGDTDSADPLVNDEEINYAYTQEGTIKQAAARCLETLANKYARYASRKLGPIKEELDGISKAFASQARELRRSAAGDSTPSSASTGGGMISTNTHTAVFDIGMNDNEE